MLAFSVLPPLESHPRPKYLSGYDPPSVFTYEMLKLCLQNIDLAVYAAPDVDSKQCIPRLSRVMHDDRIGFSTFKTTKPKVATLVRNMTAIPLHPSLERLLLSFSFLSNPLFVPRILISFEEHPQPLRYHTGLAWRQCYAFRQARCRVVGSRMIQTIWDPAV